MAFGADFNLNFRDGCPDGEFVAAAAGCLGGGVVFGMNVLFHNLIIVVKKPCLGKSRGSIDNDFDFSIIKPLCSTGF